MNQNSGKPTSQNNRITWLILFVFHEVSYTFKYTFKFLLLKTFFQHKFYRKRLNLGTPKINFFLKNNLSVLDKKPYKTQYQQQTFEIFTVQLAYNSLLHINTFLHSSIHLQLFISSLKKFQLRLPTFETSGRTSTCQKQDYFPFINKWLFEIYK